MKSFALMNRRTGDLFEAYRVSLFDKFLVNADLEGDAYGIHLSRLEHDGWVIFRPKAMYWMWFNNKDVERFFENLGEL